MLLQQSPHCFGMRRASPSVAILGLSYSHESFHEFKSLQFIQRIVWHFFKLIIGVHEDLLDSAHIQILIYDLTPSHNILVLGPADAREVALYRVRDENLLDGSIVLTEESLGLLEVLLLPDELPDFP